MPFKASIIALLLLVFFTANAQNQDYSFSKIDIGNGLSSNQVNAIFKDDIGFMWFATMSGLDRYDGYKFKVFKHKLHDTASLPDDYVTKIQAGPANKMWLMTRDGWSIYDPITESFNTRPLNFLRSIAIPGDNFTNIIKDRRGNFWFIFPEQGLYVYNPSTGKTSSFRSGKGGSLYSNNVNHIAENSLGDIWIVYNDGTLEKLDGNSYRVNYRSDVVQRTYKNKTNDLQLFIDKQNEVWIYTITSSSGAYYYKPANNTIIHLSRETNGLNLNSDILTGITQDDKGMIWIATDHGGINLYDKTNSSVRYLVNVENDNKSLSQNSITSIYKDAMGIVWIGTFKKGINLLNTNAVKFPLFSHNPYQKNSLSYNDVNRFVEDAAGNLWIGTNGGGLLYYNRTSNTFKQYLHISSNVNSISNNVIVSLFIDHEQKLWIGTFHGGLDCFDGKTFTHFKHNNLYPNSLGDESVWEIFEDSKQRLWIGTLQQGLDRYDRDSKSFIHCKPGMLNSVQSTYVSAIIEDKNRNIWIGTSQGIDVLNNSNGLFKHYQHNEKDTTSLSQDNVIDIVEDSRGLIWIATHDGLNIFDPVKKQFKVYRKENGLPDNAILTIVEDDKSNMWLSSPEGISHVTVSSSANNLKLKFKNYDETDGLQGREFNENAALKTSQGEVVFGGANGFNLFKPENIKDDRTPSKLAITDFRIFNHSVNIGEEYNGKVVLPRSVSRLQEIVLNYRHKVFTIEFAALDFLKSEKTRYAYKLEGFNKEWLITDGKNNTATFTNLDAGDYTFKLKTINADGSDSSETLSFKIDILPPFWLTPLAYILYFLLMAFILVLVRRFELKRAKAKFDIEQERKENYRLHELDLMKIKFFTNVSHEFRTPLSLIITPIERLMQASRGLEVKQYELIHRNARRLLNLVNQLLDFRKLEEHELHVNKAPGDIIQFIKALSFSFSDIAETKRINLMFKSPVESFNTVFDHDKIERILFNLLSNAFKFTPEGGTVQVAIDMPEYDEHHEKKVIQLKVIDTGIGIEKDKQEKIFERFFQNTHPETMINQGSGIGLAIAKEFVKLHDGVISVESEPGKGSCFTVSIPVTAIALASDKAAEEDFEVEPEMPEVLEETSSTVRVESKSALKKTILLVEDNEDFRFYIKDNLKASYNIVEATNGKAGWQKALSAHPDLIVSDISMPVMDGIELCKKIKEDKRTSFIPVVLLTALPGEEKQLAGLQIGASDYLTKPFNFEILLSKIKNLLSQQETFKKTYQKQVQVNASDIVIESADDKFMQNALIVVEKNLFDPEFSVEEMSRQLFMSRVGLYKKIFALTGKTPIEFIRSIRLKRAAQLLEAKDMTVAEVAYSVGFNNPKNFSKYFKTEYNVLPSEFSNQESKNVQEGKD